MSYDVNKIIEESVANIMDEPKDDDVLQEGAVTTPEGELQETEGMFLLDEEAFFDAKKNLMEFVGVDPETAKKA